ncbi:hypothetical protein H8A92_30705 [Bradyrhizobium sp. 10BB]|nr:hypothetical protein [Bradyrhizobium acaciae]
MQHLVADAVDHGKCDFGSVLGRIDVDTERPLAEPRVDDLNEGVRVFIDYVMRVFARS